MDQQQQQGVCKSVEKDELQESIYLYTQHASYLAKHQNNDLNPYLAELFESDSLQVQREAAATAAHLKPIYEGSILSEKAVQCLHWFAFLVLSAETAKHNY